MAMEVWVMGRTMGWGLVVITVFVKRLLVVVVVETATEAMGKRLLPCMEPSKVSCVSVRTLAPPLASNCLGFLDLRFFLGVEVLEWA